MFQRGQDHKRTTGTTVKLSEYCLPLVLRYVACRVNDSGITEDLTINIIKTVINEQICYYDDNRLLATIFTEARKQVRSYFETGAGNTRFTGLSTEEEDILALRIGTNLPVEVISNVTGKSGAKIRTLVLESLAKLRCHNQAGCLKDKSGSG